MNNPAPTNVTFEPMVNVEMEVPPKAHAPIDVTVSGIDTAARFLELENALSAMVFTPDGIETEVIESLLEMPHILS